MISIIIIKKWPRTTALITQVFGGSQKWAKSVDFAHFDLILNCFEHFGVKG